VRLDEPLELAQRQMLQHGVKYAILMPHGVAPLVSRNVGDVRARVESMPCASSAKNVPDSRGSSPAMTTKEGCVY
jgi:hypothetical protein